MKFNKEVVFPISIGAIQYFAFLSDISLGNKLAIIVIGILMTVIGGIGLGFGQIERERETPKGREA